MSIIEKAVSSLQIRNRTADTAAQKRGKNAEEDTVQRASRMPSPAEADGRNSQAPQLNGYEPAELDAAGQKYVSIPFDTLQHLGFLTPSTPRSSIAEEYRTIKRPLLMNIAEPGTAPGGNANLIMVTSALQGDGKTFSSINLALSIAMEQDKTVLFVDADTAKAEAGRILGVPSNSPGLIDLLEGKGLQVADVILSTNMEKLRILPAGNIHSHSNELLASDAMRRLMLELSGRYSDRVIVFDSPPLLLTTEAGVLANLMGQIVFVVGAESTPQIAVTQALEHIGQDKVVGIVLNRARRHTKLFGYGYGYNYRRYGYGYAYGSTGRVSSAE